MGWSVIDFGRYAGLTLPQIVFADPDWFFWAVVEGAFSGPLASEAERIAARARRIKVPQPEGGDRNVVEYAISRWGRFAGIEVVSANRRPHEGSTRTCRRGWIDLAFPRSLCRYDKRGGRQIVREAKYILFGSISTRMTKERAEAFFDDDSNFDLP